MNWNGTTQIFSFQGSTGLKFWREEAGSWRAGQAEEAEEGGREGMVFPQEKGSPQQAGGGGGRSRGADGGAGAQQGKFSQEVEEKIAQFLEANPMYYNLSHHYYKNKVKKMLP